MSSRQSELPPSITESSGDSTAATSSTVCCVNAAGTMSHTERGASSLAARSASDVAPVAPSAVRAGDRVGVDVVDDHVVTRGAQPAGEACAHAAESDHSDLHGGCPPRCFAPAGVVAAGSAVERGELVGPARERRSARAAAARG